MVERVEELERPSSVAAEERPLDDVMLAMDVVDTLRHRQRLVERELDAESREEELVERLRQIYDSQGIAVPDRILQEGVRALEEHRFVYTAPQGGLQVCLARIYVSRARWSRKLAIALAVLAGLWGVWHVAWELPRERRQQAFELRLAEVLPAELDAAQDACLELAATDEIRRLVGAVHEGGKAALARRDATGAEQALERLRDMEARLRREYAVRIVSRPGELSAVWRHPEDDPRQRNHYLIVEAVDRNGKALSVSITSEEDQRTRVVEKWGVRVDEATYERFKEDKLDDGIIQNARVGQKRRGYLDHEYTIDTNGGAILDWR